MANAVDANLAVKVLAEALERNDLSAGAVIAVRAGRRLG